MKNYSRGRFISCTGNTSTASTFLLEEFFLDFYCLLKDLKYILISVKLLHNSVHIKLYKNIELKYLIESN